MRIQNNSQLKCRLTHTKHHSKGIALIFVLIMMTLATSIAIISAKITLSEERSARNDRDRQIAFQSAEMALNDAELDIMDPIVALAGGRGCKIGKNLIAGEGCASIGETRGLCGTKPSLGDTPIYKDINWEDTSTSRSYVNYGEFTDRSGALQVGTVGAPSVAPKYIILQTTIPVIVPFNDGKQQYETTSAYKVYALGYGASRNTQVMLESVIVKPLLSSKCAAGGGL